MLASTSMFWHFDGLVCETPNQYGVRDPVSSTYPLL